MQQQILKYGEPTDVLTKQKINKRTFGQNVGKEQKHKNQRPLGILTESGPTDK